MTYTDIKNLKIPQNIAGFIRTRWMIILVILVITAGTAFGFNFWLKTNSYNQLENLNAFTVRRDSLIVTVTETGSIKPRSTIDIECQVEVGRDGGVRIASIVPEGTYITQEDVDNGKVLLHLDDSAFTEELTQREMDYASASASLTQSREAKKIQEKQNASDISAARLTAKWALMDLKKYLGEENTSRIINDVNNGLVLSPNYLDSLLENMNESEVCGAAQRLKEINNSIIQTDQNLKLTQNKLNGTKRLYEAKYVSELELRQDELAVKTNSLRKSQDELSLYLFSRYDFPRQVQKLLSDYNESNRKLQRTYAIARSRLAQSQAELKNNESRYQSQKEELQETKKLIELCTIKATSPGLVVYGGTDDDDHWRRRRGSGIIAVGETVFEHQKLITMPDTADMIAEIYIHESAVAAVRPDQPAKITVATFPDKIFTGRVLKINTMPNRQRWFSRNIKLYTAQVSIDGSHDYLKPGMSTEVEILVEHLTNTIIVPIRTVTNQAARKVSYRLTPSGIEPREVLTGTFNQNYVQIINGLQVGDKVLLDPPRMTQALSLPLTRLSSAKTTSYSPSTKNMN
jgi:multidrug efflux pump subunit AcrA (membrane-fusion protein)